MEGELTSSHMHTNVVHMFPLLLRSLLLGIAHVLERVKEKKLPRSLPVHLALQAEFSSPTLRVYSAVTVALYDLQDASKYLSISDSDAPKEADLDKCEKLLKSASRCVDMAATALSYVPGAIWQYAANWFSESNLYNRIAEGTHSVRHIL